MTEQGLETIKTAEQKTYEWIARIAMSMNVLAVVANHIGGGEMQRAIDAFPRDMQSLFPALASAA